MGIICMHTHIMHMCAKKYLRATVSLLESGEDTEEKALPKTKAKLAEKKTFLFSSLSLMMLLIMRLSRESGNLLSHTETTVMRV